MRYFLALSILSLIYEDKCLYNLYIENVEKNITYLYDSYQALY